MRRCERTFKFDRWRFFFLCGRSDEWTKQRTRYESLGSIFLYFFLFFFHFFLFFFLLLWPVPGKTRRWPNRRRGTPVVAHRRPPIACVALFFLFIYLFISFFTFSSSFLSFLHHFPLGFDLGEVIEATIGDQWRPTATHSDQWQPFFFENPIPLGFQRLFVFFIGTAFDFGDVIEATIGDPRRPMATNGDHYFTVFLLAFKEDVYSLFFYIAMGLDSDDVIEATVGDPRRPMATNGDLELRFS